MTSQSTVISTSLVNRVCERAAREPSVAGVPLIVLDEMHAEGLHLQGESRLESAKMLLVAAYRSAVTANDSSRENACIA
ncbi:MAG: hypothetical protein HQ518_13645 [Rhodopirellula sp.]|nr:hypothetical protein [Rhodopirellula sp.]